MKLQELYNLAKSGNKDALNCLFNRNYKMIENMAIFAFNSIKKNVNRKDIPNSLLDYDDIMQELSVKAYELFIKYFNNNSSSLYLSGNINHNLKYYTMKLIEKKSKEVINELNIDRINRINLDNNYEDRNLKFELLDEVNNSLISHHYDFIADIFNGKSYSDIASKYNINIKGISVKMKHISSLYNKYINNNDLLYNYVKSGEFSEELKSGNIYDMKYFNKEIIFILHDIYMFLKEYYIPYFIIKNEFLKLFISYLNKTCINNNVDINNYINKVLNSCKEIYINDKLKDYNYIISLDYNKYFYKDLKVSSNIAISFIINGDIYLIHPYSVFIDIYVNYLYQKLSKTKYVDISDIKCKTIDKITKLAKRYFKNNEYNINKFNSYLKEMLSFDIDNLKPCNKVLFK